MSVEAIDTLMDGQRADLCFTSPPYAQQRDYGAAKEKVGDWDALMQGVFACIPTKDGAQVLVNLGLVHRDSEWQPYWDNWVAWMRDSGWRRFGWYVWDQGPGLPGDWNGRLAPSHEFIFHFNRAPRRVNKTVESKHGGKTIGGGGLRGKDGVVRQKTGAHSANLRRRQEEISQTCDKTRLPPLGRLTPCPPLKRPANRNGPARKEAVETAGSP